MGEMTVLLIVHGVMAGIFTGLGILFFKGKGSFLIAGYNTASKAEKENIDEKKLCKYMGKLMFSLAGSVLVILASDVWNEMWLLWLGLALFFGIILGGIIYINTGGRLKK